jgi:hypothetical protein
MPFNDPAAAAAAAAGSLSAMEGGCAEEDWWGPARCARLGRSLLDALVHVGPLLRRPGPVWEGLPAEDAYVRPRDPMSRGPAE